MALLLGLWWTLRGSDRYDLAWFYLRPLRWNNTNRFDPTMGAENGTFRPSSQSVIKVWQGTTDAKWLISRQGLKWMEREVYHSITLLMVIAMKLGHHLMTLSDLKCIIWKDMFMSEDSNLPSHLLCIIIVHSNIIILGLWSFFSLFVLSLTSLLCPARPKIRQHNPLISRLHTSLHKPQPHSRLNQLWNLGYVL